MEKAKEEEKRAKITHLETYIYWQKIDLYHPSLCKWNKMKNLKKKLRDFLIIIIFQWKQAFILFSICFDNFTNIFIVFSNGLTRFEICSSVHARACDFHHHRLSESFAIKFSTLARRARSLVFFALVYTIWRPCKSRCSKQVTAASSAILFAEER